MQLDLTKGVSFDLTKEVPSLKTVKIGLGWDVADGITIDLDVAAFVLENDEKRTNKEGNVCYFKQLSILGDAIKHTGDNRDGEGEGDDESIIVDLEKVVENLPNVSEIHFPVFMFAPNDAEVTFGKVKNSFIRVVDNSNNQEIAKYQLEEEYFSSRAITFGKLSKDDTGTWKFTAVGEEIVGQVADATGGTFNHFTG